MSMVFVQRKHSSSFPFQVIGALRKIPFGRPPAPPIAVGRENVPERKLSPRSIDSNAFFELHVKPIGVAENIACIFFLGAAKKM